MSGCGEINKFALLSVLMFVYLRIIKNENMNLENKTTIKILIKDLKPGDIVSNIPQLHSKQVPPVIMEFVKNEDNVFYFKQISGEKIYGRTFKYPELIGFSDDLPMCLIVDAK